MLPPAVKELIQRQRNELREARKAHRDRLRAADELARALRRVSDLIWKSACKRDPGRRVIGTHLGPFVGLGLAASEALQRARVKPQQLIPGLGSV